MVCPTHKTLKWQKVEQIIRDNGATPATIAIMDGKIKIGLNENDLETLANSPNVAKVSRRDLAEIVATKNWGYNCCFYYDLFRIRIPFLSLVELVVFIRA